MAASVRAMNRIIAGFAAPLAVATTLFFCGIAPAVAQGACMSNMEMQAALARGEVRSLPEVMIANGYDLREWQVLGAPELCRQPSGAFVYRISVQSRTGEARTLVLRASG